MKTYNPKTVLKDVRILIIEDDVFIAKVYAKWLTLAGAVVVTASNGAIGLRIAAEHIIDVIILDLGMPGMNGGDTLRALRRRKSTATTPVIVMSNTTMKESSASYYDLQNAGVSDIFRKYEISLKEIVECVHKYAQRANIDIPVK